MMKPIKLSDGATYCFGANGERICTGSRMGRADSVPSDATERESSCKLRLVKLRWVDGAYDQGGAYWGRTAGTNIYLATGDVGEEVAEVYVRAASRKQAKEMVREKLPNARFYR